MDILVKVVWGVLAFALLSFFVQSNRKAARNLLAGFYFLKTNNLNFLAYARKLRFIKIANQTKKPVFRDWLFWKNPSYSLFCIAKRDFRDYSAGASGVDSGAVGASGTTGSIGVSTGASGVFSSGVGVVCSSIFHLSF